MTNKIIGIIAVLGLLVGGYAALHTGQSTTYIDQNGQPQVGAVATNQPTDPFYFAGGLTSKTSGFISTSTIVCAQQNQSFATTTFRARWMVTTATSTQTVMTISTTTNAGRFGTTTSILSKTLASGVQGADVWNGANSNNILGPGEWVVFGYGAGTTDNPGVAMLQGGTCSVTFDNIK